jgi:glycosyltransferase involved in cell wall biosynthesis
VIVGDGKLKSEVEAILESGGVRDLAWFAGERADVVPVLQGLDCFVLPSLAEGVSIRSSRRCPAACRSSPRGSGPMELVEEDMTGRTVPPGRQRSLARAIGTYFAAPGLAREHAGRRRRVERKFNLERMVENYHRVYSDLLAGRANRIETSDRALMRHRGNR